MTKTEIWKLRDNIIKNIDYLSKEYQRTEEILSDLNRMVSLDMSHSMMFGWWVKNENSISIINELLKDLK